MSQREILEAEIRQSALQVYGVMKLTAKYTSLSLRFLFMKCG